MRKLRLSETGSVAVLLLAAACASQCPVESPSGTLPSAVAVDQAPNLVLRSRNIPLEQGESALALSALQASTEARMHIFVRFAQKPEANDFRELDRAGVELLRYLDLLVYVVSVPAGRDSPPNALAERATWYGRILPVDKLDAALTDRQASPWAIDLPTGGFRVLAVFFRDVSRAEVEKQLAEIGLRAVPYGANSFELVLPPSSIDALLELDIVEFVEEVPKPSRPLNDHSQSRNDQGFGTRVASVVAGSWNSNRDPACRLQSFVTVNKDRQSRGGMS